MTMIDATGVATSMGEIELSSATHAYIQMDDEFLVRWIPPDEFWPVADKRSN